MTTQSNKTDVQNEHLTTAPKSLVDYTLTTSPISLAEYLIKLATSSELQLQHRDASVSGLTQLYEFLLNEGLPQADARVLADAQHNQTTTSLLRLRLIDQTGFVLQGDSNSVVNQIIGGAEASDDGGFTSFHPNESNVLTVEIDIATGKRKSATTEFNARISGTVMEEY